MLFFSRRNLSWQSKNCCANSIFLYLDLSFESCSLHSLRLELASLIEKTRLTDKKQSELEKTISRLEEENSQKTAQIIELNERCSDKLSLISSLESKLNMRNNKVVELQNELTLKETEFLENDAKVREPFREIYLESSYVEREVSNNFSTFWICFLLLCCIINV